MHNAVLYEYSESKVAVQLLLLHFTSVFVACTTSIASCEQYHTLVTT